MRPLPTKRASKTDLVTVLAIPTSIIITLLILMMNVTLTTEPRADLWFNEVSVHY